jgi:glycosyltransferase involved in cell wall biosynthesis
MLSKNFSIPREKILPIGGGVDDEFIQKIKETNSSRKRFDACFIGRIHPSKGVFDLITAWSTVRRQIPGAHLVIIGGGYPNYQKKLENAIKKLNLRNNITLLGHVSEEEKFRTLMQSKFLVHPAYEECIPLTFFEAASVDVPIITYYLPTYENVRECLISVRKGDVKQLGTTLMKCILAYNENKKTFYPLIKKERELAKKHTWRNIARSLLSETGLDKK